MATYILKNFVKNILNSSTKKQVLFLITLGVIFYIPFLGHVNLFDWDEINFAEIAREMRVTGNYFTVQINYQPFFEKPPLFAWVQNVSYFFFGVNEFAARFPNALFGIFTLLLIYFSGKRVKGNAFGLLWALLFFGSVFPHLFYKSGIIDPVFNFFIFASIVYSIFILNDESAKKRHFFLAGIINGLGILAKGPVALLILLLTFFFYWLFQSRKRDFISFGKMALFGLGVLFMAGFLVWPGNDPQRACFYQRVCCLYGRAAIERRSRPCPTLLLSFCCYFLWLFSHFNFWAEKHSQNLASGKV